MGRKARWSGSQRYREGAGEGRGDTKNGWFTYCNNPRVRIKGDSELEVHVSILNPAVAGYPINAA